MACICTCSNNLRYIIIIWVMLYISIELNKELGFRISKAKTISGQFNAKLQWIRSPLQLPVPVDAVYWAVQPEQEPTIECMLYFSIAIVQFTFYIEKKLCHLLNTIVCRNRKPLQKTNEPQNLVTSLAKSCHHTHTHLAPLTISQACWVWLICNCLDLQIFCSELL